MYRFVGFENAVQNVLEKGMVWAVFSRARVKQG
jgi:hypothetical protein